MNLCTSWSFVPSASIGTNMWRGATLERISSVVSRHFFWNWFKINQSLLDLLNVAIIFDGVYICIETIYQLPITYNFINPLFIVDLFFIETSQAHSCLGAKWYSNMSITYLLFLFVTELWRNMNQINGLDFHDKILCYDLFEGYLSQVLL